MANIFFDNLRNASRRPMWNHATGMCALIIAVLTGLILKPSTACAQGAPAPTILSTTPMGPVTQNPLIVGRDGTWSAVINGVSMWSFSDTKVSASNAKGDSLISNSRAWTTSLDASSGIDLTGDILGSNGKPTTSFPFTQDESSFNSAHGGQSGCTTAADPLCGEQYAIWAAPVIAPGPLNPYEGYFFYKLLMRGGAISGRDVVGVGIAYLENGVMTRPILSPGSPHPTLMWQETTPGSGATTYTAYYGGGIVIGNMLYMTSADTIGGGGHHIIYMARVPLADILNLSDWTYYNSTNEWVSDSTQASQVFLGSPNGSTIIYLAPLYEYITMYSLASKNNDVLYRVAPQPWGPWSDPEATLFTGQPPIEDDGDYDYDALPHPEFQEQNGLVQYVTYVQHDLALGQGGEQVQLENVTFAPPPTGSTPTTTSLATPGGSYDPNASFAVTATISPAAAATISFYDASNFLGTSTSSATDGTATLTVSNLAAGAHTLTAMFPGTATYAPSSGTASVSLVADNVWIANSNGTLSLVNPAGVALENSGGSGGATAVAVDHAGNVWSVDRVSNTVSESTRSGVLLNAGSGTGGVSAPAALAIDGSGLAWVANSDGTISVLSTPTIAVSATPYDIGTSNPTSLNIDSAGNLWLTNAGDDSVTEVFGVASPVATPIVSAVINGTVGSKP